MVEVTPKSKKNEIFDAYQELLDKVQENKTVTHQEAKQHKDDVEVVTKASNFNPEHIVSTLAQVKLTTNQGLDMLEKRLIEEYRRLNELQTAIKLETENLEELHQITKNADSLTALILAQKEQRARFEEEMAQKKADLQREIETKQEQWNREQDQFDLERKERIARFKKECQREEEEYRYTIATEHKRDQDVYEAKKLALEKELVEKRTQLEQEFSKREQLLVTAEEELKTLRVKVAQFPQELEHAITTTETEVRQSVERDYGFKMDLFNKEIIGDKKLNQQIIASLQDKIKEQEQMIKQLTQKSDIANSQVQSIAIKALESASGTYELKKSPQVSL